MGVGGKLLHTLWSKAPKESTNKETDNKKARETKIVSPPKNWNLVRNCRIQLWISAGS